MTMESKLNELENSVQSEIELSEADRKLIRKLQRKIRELEEEIETIDEKPAEGSSHFTKLAWEISGYLETGSFPEDFKPTNLEAYLDIYQTEAEAEEEQVNKLFNLLTD